MAKVIIKSHHRYNMEHAPRVPFYKIKLEIVGSTETMHGSATVNYEHNKFNFVWFSPASLDDLDNKWNNKLHDYLIHWADKNILVNK